MSVARRPEMRSFSFYNELTNTKFVFLRLWNLKCQISNLYFNTVKIHQVFCYIWSINYITIFNNNKYISKESLKNTTLFLIIDTICPKIWAKIPLKNEKSPLPSWRASLKNVCSSCQFSPAADVSRLFSQATNERKIKITRKTVHPQSWRSWNKHWLRTLALTYFEGLYQENSAVLGQFCA